MDNISTQGNSAGVATRFSAGALVSRNAQTMSSREIAELVGSRHDKVKQSIERLAERGVIGLPPMGEVRNHLGQSVAEYRVGKRDSYIIVAQLCPEFTARLVDRWQELEEAARQPAIPQTLPEALRLAADLAEQNTHLQLVVSEQAPKVEALQRIAEARGAMCLTDAAKHLGLRRVDLLDWMRANRWIYRREGSARWVAYQPREAAGLLEHKVTLLGLDEEGDQRLASQVKVTAKGLTLLAQKIGGAR